MKKVLCWFLCLAPLTLAVAHGDDGYFGGAGASVYAEKTGQVRMAWEKVTLKRVKSKDPRKAPQIYAECVFSFENLGGATDFTMGFPAESSGESDYKPTLIKDFKTFIGGKAYPVKMKKVEVSKQVAEALDVQFDHAYVWPVHLAAHGTLEVKNTYHVEESGGQDVLAEGPSIPYFDNDIPEQEEIFYILKSGALWAGTIGQADITLDLGEKAPEAFLAIGPAGYTYKDGVITWSLKDLKPTADISVVLHPGPIKPMKGDITYEKLEKDLDQGPFDWLQKRDKTARALEKLAGIRKTVLARSSDKNQSDELYVLDQFEEYLKGNQPRFVCRIDDTTQDIQLHFFQAAAYSEEQLKAAGLKPGDSWAVFQGAGPYQGQKRWLKKEKEIKSQSFNTNYDTHSYVMETDGFLVVQRGSESLVYELPYRSLGLEKINQDWSLIGGKSGPGNHLAVDFEGEGLLQLSSNYKWLKDAPWTADYPLKPMAKKDYSIGKDF